MTTQQIIGAAILAAFFSIIIFGLCRNHGVREACGILGFAFGVTITVLFACFMLSGGFK